MFEINNLFHSKRKRNKRGKTKAKEFEGNLICYVCQNVAYYDR